MSTSIATLEPLPSETSVREITGTLLVCLPSATSESLQEVSGSLAEAYPGVRLLFAAPEGHALNVSGEAVPLIHLPVPPRSHPSWVLVASDYEAATTLAKEHAAAATLVLGSEAESLSGSTLVALSQAVLTGGVDVAIPRYTLHPHEGLVSAALLYPLTRTLFGAPVHLPLPLDFAFSGRANDRLGAAARRQSGSSSGAGFLWPVAEASLANLRVAEILAGSHSVPSPADTDLNALLGEVLSSAFLDIEAKAAFWQRARVPSAPASFPAAPLASVNVELDDITPMVDSFRNAFANLQSIWSLVLPPHSLLALKKLSLTPPAQFRMPPSLWARTVYEFVLAFHLRTINRGHLLGAFTPLYLAWVASYIGQVDDNPEAASAFIEQNAAVFEAEKPYLVSRWRWPDRFNP